MPVIESQLVKVEIATIAGDNKSVLRLNYQAQIYDLVRVFACDRLDPTGMNQPERIERQLQQSMLQGRRYATGVQSSDAVRNSLQNEYLLVREIGYYSLWQLDRSTSTVVKSVAKSDLEAVENLSLQQASIWLFQELWLQLDDLLGDRQLQLLSENLILVTPHVRSWVDLDRLLALDPLAADELKSWSEVDAIALTRKIYHLTQKKLGHQFGTKLTLEIVESMPDSLGSALKRVLDL